MGLKELAPGCRSDLRRPRALERRVLRPRKPRVFDTARNNKLRRVAPTIRRALMAAAKRAQRRRLELERENRLEEMSPALAQARRLTEILAHCRSAYRRRKKSRALIINDLRIAGFLT